MGKYLTKKIYFFCEEGIPFLKNFFIGWGDWIEFNNIHELSRLITDKLIHIPEICSVVFFIKTSTRFDSSWKKIFPLFKQIRIVATAAVGNDHIDFPFLKKNQIRFYSSPGCNRSAVIDYIFFLIIKYSLSRKKSLENLTVGIIGLGNIGCLLATQLLRFKIQIIAYDPRYGPKTIPKGLSKQTSFSLASSLDKILSHPKVNVITLHVPLTNKCPHSTLHLISKKSISLLIKGRTEKPLLINTSRGGVVDEGALLPYLGEVDYAADVWENEPYINPKVAEKSFFITPHIAGYTYHAKREAARMVYQQITTHLLTRYGIKQKSVSSSSFNKLTRQMEMKDEKNIPFFFLEKTKYRGGLERILFSVCAQITGLESLNKKMRKQILPLRPEQRSQQFKKIRGKSLRDELGDYHYKLNETDSKKKKQPITMAYKIFNEIFQRKPLKIKTVES